MISPTTPGLITTSATAPMSTAVAALPTRLTRILLPTTRLPKSARRSRPTSIATAQTGKRPRMARTTATLESMSRSARGSRIRPSRVGPARRAILPSRKSVAAASTKKAAPRASARASSSATTTGTMKSRRRERALGTVNTLSPKPLASSDSRISLTTALNPHPHAHPPQIIPLPQSVLHVSQISFRYVLWPGREEGEPRGRTAGLGRVADLDAFRRRVAGYELVHEFGELVGGDAQVVGPVDAGRERQHLLDPVACKRGDGDRPRLEVAHARCDSITYLA